MIVTTPTAGGYGDDVSWRAESASRIKGESFVFKKWKPSGSWDHDHCAGCWKRICAADDFIGDDFKADEGYAITADYSHGEDYEWVCEECFEKLKDVLGFKIAQKE